MKVMGKCCDQALTLGLHRQQVGDGQLASEQRALGNPGVDPVERSAVEDLFQVGVFLLLLHFSNCILINV